MSIILNKDSATATREREGVWIRYGDGELLIARMGNPRNREVFQRIRAPYKRQIKAGSLTDKQQAKIVAETYAESILLDWRGQVDEDGNEIEYSREMAQVALENDMDLREFVEQSSSDASVFRAEQITETGKG